MPRPTLSRICALLLAFILIPGCSTARQSNLEDQPTVFASAIPRMVERKRDLLTFEEIRRMSARNAYEAVVQLRPEFLRQRGQEHDDLDPRNPKSSALERAAGSEPPYPAVFLNGLQQGGPATLRTIPAMAILEIRFYREMHIPTIYGVNHPGGVIDVRTAP